MSRPVATLRGDGVLAASIERGEIAPTEQPKVFRLVRDDPIAPPQQNLRGHTNKSRR